jgi:nicotinate-nucleotide adenylyltransferase|tara:strand:+ start:385 stop:1041 length:657 start_codon:yes stop_codon:yes gene_type:complete
MVILGSEFRLGVLGGMFDPVHKGHVEAAIHASRLLQLDKLKLVPCHVPNHRSGPFVSGLQRQQMLEIAIAGHKALEVDSIELDRVGVSYMVDTLVELAAANTSASIVLVIGMDSFNSLPSWHKFEEISQLCHLLVLSRAGEEAVPTSKSKVDTYWQGKDDVNEIFVNSSGNYYIERDFNFDISSTAVRDAIRNKDKLSALLDDDVATFISDQHLYSTN